MGFNMIVGQPIPQPGRFAMGAGLIESLLIDTYFVMFDYTPGIAVHVAGGIPTITATKVDMATAFEKKYSAELCKSFPTGYKFLFGTDLKLIAVETVHKAISLHRMLEISPSYVEMKPMLQSNGDAGIKQLFKYFVKKACSKEAKEKPYLAYTDARVGIYVGDKEPVYTNYVVSGDLLDVFCNFGKYDEYSEVKFWTFVYDLMPEILPDLQSITLTSDFLRTLGR